MSGLKAVLIVFVSLFFANLVALADTVYVSRWVDNNGTDNASEGVIYRVDPASQGLIPIALGFDHLALGVCGPDGNLYFAERGKHRVIRVSQDGPGVTEIFRTLGRDPWDAPEGPSFDGQGNLYWTNTGSGGVWGLESVDPKNQPVQIVQQFGAITDYIIGAGTAILTKGPYAGAVIVAGNKDNIVYKIDPADFCTSTSSTNCGRPKVFLQKNLQHPYGLAINSRGEISSLATLLLAQMDL